MNPHPLLAENESKRLNFRLPLLICFALYTAWQMGVGYYSGDTLSIDGRTPLPVDVGNLTALIAAGYLLSIVFMIILPRFIVWAERITALVALLFALPMFLPLAPDLLSAFYYIQCFCCLFMIGFELAIIINLFSEKTAIKYLLVAYPFALIIIALLQMDFFKLPFSAFRFFTVISLAFMLVFFWKLPAFSWPQSVRKNDKIVAPKSLFAGFFLLTVLGNFVFLFGNAVAESIPHGLFTMYLSTCLSCVMAFLLWKRLKITPLHSVKILIAISAFGFTYAIAAKFLPLPSLISCVLIGAGSTSCVLIPFYSLLIAKRYPSRFITPVIAGLALLTVLVHTVLLDTFRNNLILLYIIYLIIAVGMIILYLVLEPYLLYSFRGRTLQDIIGVVEEEPDESKYAPVPAAEVLNRRFIDRGSPPEPTPIAQTAVEKPAPPLDKSLQEQRMKILLTHTLEPLTRREYQLTDCMLRGLRRSEIAKEMGILPVTISNYRNSIYSKFDIHSRQELFRLAETLNREWPEEDT